MSSISGYGYSRGNYSQVLRARESSRSESGRNEKSDRNDKSRSERSRSEKSRGDSEDTKVKEETKAKEDANSGSTKETTTTRSLGDNVVVNGSFEKHNLGENTWGLREEIEGFKSTNDKPIELQTGVAGKASDGQTLVELDSTGNSGISQEVKTEKGEKYQLSVDYSARPGVASESNTVEVYFNGKKIDTLNAEGRGKSDTSFETKTYEVEATGDSSRLEFRAAGTSDSLGGYIDNVKLQKITVETKGGVDDADLEDISKKLAELKQGVDKANATGGNNGAAIGKLTEQFKDVASKLDSVAGQASGNSKKLDSLGEQFKDVSEALGKAISGTDRNSKQIAEVQETTKAVTNKLDGLSQKVDANGKKIDDLGGKFDSLRSDLGGKVDRVSKEVAELGGRLDVRDGESAKQFKQVNERIDNVSEKQDANFKETNARIDDLGSKVKDRFDSTDKKIDDLGGRVDSRFDDVDSKLNDINDKLGGQVGDVANDLTEAVTELKDAIKDVGTNNDSKLTDAVKNLKTDFNKQFNDLKSQHEAETNALLSKLDEVTTALKTLSEQSSEQIAVLKDKLGGLGGQLGTVINKIDMLGQGQNLSQRSLGLFNAAAKVGDGALDKLIGLVGPGGGGNQLRNVQSRLQSVSARYGGSGQGAEGVSLLA